MNFDFATHGEDRIGAASVLPNLRAAYPETLGLLEAEKLKRLINLERGHHAVL